MTWTSAHISWLVRIDQTLSTANQKPIEVWEFRHQPNPTILSAWATHFRNHYCRDGQIDILRNGTGLSRGEFLTNIKFPDSQSPLGPAIKSGDFGEILVSDYMEFVLNFWVPRTRYVNKATRNESTKGSDVIGLKFHGNNRDSKKDTLAIFEVKAQLSGNSLDPKLQQAIDGSKKDDLRKAESLNAIKQYFINKNKTAEALKVERFQDSEDRPYKELRGAVAVLDSGLFDTQRISESNTSGHPFIRNLKLLTIHGQNMMPLVNELYRRAADEA